MIEENNNELKNMLENKDEKLKNQSNELDHLTNNIIPKLKEENSELKKLKIELSEALEKSTEKYFTQLDINSDLCDKLTKTGAEHALNKVKLDKIESEMKIIKDDASAKVDEITGKFENIDLNTIEEIKEENKSLKNDLKEKNNEIDDLEEETLKLKNEIDEYCKQIIEIGDYKEKVESDNKGNIIKLENEISELKTQLKIKQSNYDKLKSDDEKTIKNLENEIEKLKTAINKHENKGFFERLSNKSVKIDDG